MLYLFTAITILLAWNTHFLLNVNATTQPPTFLSLPLSRPVPTNAADIPRGYLHGSIVQQQHINRAIKRLALMTSSTIPSKFELLWNLHQRISPLSAELQYKYDLDAITAILAEHYAVDVSLPSSNATSLLSKSVLSGIASLALVKKDAVTAGSAYANSARALHSIGLDIESTDIGYIGKVQLGTPPKSYRLLIDSGSADLWVGAEGCHSDDGGGCGNHTFLGVHSSKTFKRTDQAWAIGYVSGDVAGYMVQDVVSIAELTLKGHSFGVATNESSDFTSDDVPFDGLLGLGKPDISQQHVPTLLESLHQANLIQASIASYKLPRLADGKRDTGELTLGAMDPKHYDPKTLVTVPNVNKFGFWGVAVNAVNVGKHDMHWANRTVVMDTGTTLMIAPQEASFLDVNAVHKLIPGAEFDGNGWTVPCNMTTIISLTIGGQVFKIDPRDIAFWPLESGSQDCMSGIAAGGVGPFYLNTDWLVGDVFLKNVYFSTNEDDGTVSIAEPKL